MAYVSQEDKKELAVGIKKVLAKYNVKGTIGVHNHSTIVVRLKSGDMDILSNYWEVCKANAWKTPPHNQRSEKPTYLQVNTYYVDSHFTGEVANFLTELVAELKGEKYFNDTDIMTDYFHCSHYVEIDVGNWEKPYVFNGDLADAA